MNRFYRTTLTAVAGILPLPIGILGLGHIAVLVMIAIAIGAGYIIHSDPFRISLLLVLPGVVIVGGRFVFDLVAGDLGASVVMTILALLFSATLYYLFVSILVHLGAGIALRGAEE